MTKPKYRTQYDDETDDRIREETAARNDDPSMTMQSFTDDANINNVLARFGVTDGSLPPNAVAELIGGRGWEELDLSNAGDFRSIHDSLLDAKNQFMRLPANLRARFNNDPAYMLDWAFNPENRTEAIRLGFFKEAQPATPEASTDTNVSPST